MAKFTDFSVGDVQFRKYDDGYPIWATTAEVDAAEARERYAIGKAAENLSTILDALIAKGMSRSAAVSKLRALNLSYGDIEQLAAKAAKNKTKTTVHLEQPKPDDSEPDDDADDKLDKLAIAVQHAHREAGFSKQQALAYAVDHFPEARELVRLSKRRSISRYGEQATGHFDKAASPVPQTLPTGVAKMSDTDLTSLYRDGHFDKMAGPSGPPSSSGREMSPLLSASARPARKPKVRTDPGPGNGVIGDRANLAAGDARIDERSETPDFAAQVRSLMDTERLSEIEAMGRVVAAAREARIAKVGW